MIKDNIKTLFFYFLILILNFLLLNLIYFFSESNVYNVTLYLKFLILLIFLLVFFLYGKLTSRKGLIRDISTFLFTGFFCLVLFLLGNLAGGINFTDITNIVTLLSVIFLSPILLIEIILKLDFTLVNLLIILGYFSLIIGLGRQFSKR